MFSFLHAIHKHLPSASITFASNDQPTFTVRAFWRKLVILSGMDPTIFDRDGYKYIKSDTRGYREFKGWDDGAGGRVKSITLSYEDIVYSIQTSYEREGSIVMSRRHGGSLGNMEMINLKEPLTWVTGYYGSICLDPELIGALDEEECPWNFQKVIRSLRFGTDRASYGPFGKEIGEPFCFRSETEISGFHGYSSSCHLHGIGVYMRCLATRFLDDPPLPQLSETSSSSTGWDAHEK